MRIGSQGDVAIQMSKMALSSTKTDTQKVDKPKVATENVVTIQPVKSQVVTEEQQNTGSKEKLEEAVASINEFLSTQSKASKFVFHEGLDKYYVQLVDSETDEVIKEIPPERLLNAFYEMKKLAGMIVDEKI